MSDFELVQEFNRAAGQPAPKKPVAMDKEQVFFLCKMMLDEIMEFTASVAGPEESKNTLINFIKESKDIVQESYNKETEKIASQADALVDCYYYSLNAAGKSGIDVSQIFKVVHTANMNKRDKDTGAFKRRSDGKILKPEGWLPPDIVGEIENQMKR